MSAVGLYDENCQPTRSGEEGLSPDKVRALLSAVPAWQLADGPRLQRTLRFADFAELMVFVNRLAALAEEEGHHPDFSVRWNELVLALWTHDVSGLSRNDFILAAKLDRLPGCPS